MNIIDAVLAAALEVTSVVLNLYIWILIIGAVMSWLVAFGVINMHNRFVQLASDFIFRVTEPLLKPIRRVLPPMGGFDLAPLVLILIIMFIQSVLRHLAY